MPIDQQDVEDEAVKEGTDDDLVDEMDKEDKDIRDDPVRQQHFNYTEYSCLVNGHPEIFLNNEGNQVAIFIFCKTVTIRCKCIHTYNFFDLIKKIEFRYMF